MKKSFAMLCFGLLMGIIARLLDIYTTNLGEIFSQMASWILMGTLISVYSRTAREAMLDVLCFCMGMMLTYYVVAALSHGVFAKEFIIGWTLFALFSPVMADKRKRSISQNCECGYYSGFGPVFDYII